MVAGFSRGAIWTLNKSVWTVDVAVSLDIEHYQMRTRKQCTLTSYSAGTQHSQTVSGSVRNQTKEHASYCKPCFIQTMEILHLKTFKPNGNRSVIWVTNIKKRLYIAMTNRKKDYTSL